MQCNIPLDGRASLVGEELLEFGLPVTVPAVDLVPIALGGGSLAWVDEEGTLRVGPRSAGAVPGPACYGRGGRKPTVTDADLLLDRLPRGHTVGGLEALDAAAARRAMLAEVCPTVGRTGTLVGYEGYGGSCRSGGQGVQGRYFPSGPSPIPTVG